MKIYYLIFVLFAINHSIYSQYLGGNGDGHIHQQLLGSISIFRGGDSSGYVTIESKTPSSIYKGGDTDGFAFTLIKNAMTFYRGTLKDGYGSDLSNSTSSLYIGGNGDGYKLTSKILRWIWTGQTNGNWNLASNWLNGTLPTLNSKVVIPSNALNFPTLVGGVLSIGQDPLSGDYVCKSLSIQQTASLFLDVNASLNNYGKLTVNGIIAIDNPVLGSFTNHNMGMLNIKANGLILFN